jgi:hypothetical protein
MQMPPNWTEMAAASPERHSMGNAVPEANYGVAEMLTDYENAPSQSVNYARFPDSQQQQNYAVPSFAPGEERDSVNYGQLLPDGKKSQYAVPFN